MACFSRACERSLGVITPHPSEFSRLIDDFARIQWHDAQIAGVHRARETLAHDTVIQQLTTI